jgi:sulfite exporter TauE/SafE
MCGPIAFVLPLDRKRRDRRVLQIGMYHSGRLFTYSLIGLVFGLVGSGLYLFGLQQKVSIITGVLMIAAVVLTASSFKLGIANPFYSLVGKVKNRLGASLKDRSPDTFLTIGFLNGFLPCGLVYMAVLGAIATTSLWEGILYMALFGLGTVPLMTTAVYFGNFLKGRVRQRIRKAVPVFVVLVGLLFILRGLGLGIPYVSPKPITPKADAQIECHTAVMDTNINTLNS